MSRAEIVHRLREQFQRAEDRLRLYTGRADVDPELDALIQRMGSLKRYFLEGPARRFYPSVTNRQAIVDLFEAHYPDWLDKAIQDAAQLCEHRVSLFADKNIPLESPINWHRDPITGYRWPRRFFADYNLVHKPAVDAKVIHELNRHQHLPRLAKAFFLTGIERYACEAIEQIETWIQQNPTRHGVNWHSSLEIAIRCHSWLWTIFLLLPSRSLDEEHLRIICQSLFTQIDHIYRYPSVYTSPNTHLIGESALLYIASVLFPDLPRARMWEEFGVRTLRDEMQKQVLSDGVYGELSTYYHCYATDFYLHVLMLAQRNHSRFPQWMWNQLSRMFDFVMHITRPDGSMPLIGDDDGGRVLAIAAENYGSYRDGLCSGAVLFTRPDLKNQAGGFCEDSLWLLGSDGWNDFNLLAAQPPAELSRAFYDAGYFIQRSGWGPEETHVTFDCGDLGIGSGGHGHADALSLTLFSGGRELLIDPGTCIYNAAPAWRRFFRSTAAHNAVVVDGNGQCEPADTFRWKTKAAGRANQLVLLPEIECVDGMVDLPNGCAHRRRLIYVRPEYWIVADEITGTGTHNFDFLYHFAPDVQMNILSDESRGDIDCSASIDDAVLQLQLYGSAAIRAEALCGQTDPIQGWASRSYGERRPCPVLKASARGSAPLAMLSFMIAGNQPVRSLRMKTNTNLAIAASVKDAEYDDLIVLAMQDGELHFMDYVMRGELFWLRTEEGRLRRLFALNARLFSRGGEMLFESSDVITYVQAYLWDNGIVLQRGDDEGKVYVRDLRDRQFQRF